MEPIRKVTPTRERGPKIPRLVLTALSVAYLGTLSACSLPDQSPTPQPAKIEEADFFSARKNEIFGFPNKKMDFVTSAQSANILPNLRYDFSEANQILGTDLDPIFNITLLRDFFGLNKEKIKDTQIEIRLDGTKFPEDLKLDCCQVQFDNENKKITLTIPVEDIYDNLKTSDPEVFRTKVYQGKIDLNQRLNYGLFQGGLKILEQKGYITSDQVKELLTTYDIVRGYTSLQYTGNVGDTSWKEANFRANYNTALIITQDQWRDCYYPRLIPQQEIAIPSRTNEAVPYILKGNLTGTTISEPKGELPIQDYPQPLDLGTAMMLVDLSHPYYTEKLLPAVTDHFIQTTTRLDRDSNGNMFPNVNSWLDYIRLSGKYIDSDTMYRITHQPKGNSYERVTKEVIDLRNGQKITGYVAARENVGSDEIGLFRNMWFTIPPNKSPELLAKEIGKIHVIIDRNRIISIDPASISGSDEGNMYGFYKNGAFIYHLPMTFEKSFEVVFEGPGWEDPPPLWWIIQGVKFNKDKLPANLLIQSLFSDNPDIKKNYANFFHQIDAVSPMILTQNLSKKEVINFSPGQKEMSINRVIDNDQWLQIKLEADNWAMLDDCYVEITYPGEQTPAIKGTLRQFIGITVTGGNRFISSRYYFLTASSEGNILFSLSEMPVPKGSKVMVRSTNKEKATKVVFESMVDKFLPQQRLRFYHNFLPMNSPADQFVKSDFKLPKQLILKQIQIGLDAYKAIPQPGLWKKGPLESNIYIVRADGSLEPISTGIEDLGEAGFYDWKIKPIDPNKPFFLTNNFFVFGRGQFNDAAVLDCPEESWAYAVNASLGLKLKEGDQIRVDPYYVKGNQGANVSISLWGITF